MIEPAHLPPEEGPLPAASDPNRDPIVLEDLAAALRLPVLMRKIDRVLARVELSFPFPAEELAFESAPLVPSDGFHEYGLHWRDGGGLLQVFAGMSWGEQGHDPLWEVRVEALPGFDPADIRVSGLHRIAARRAENRFSEWDRFWWEDNREQRYLIGASAACTRFLEEPDPDASAAEYLAGALHSLCRSGALSALLEAARESPSAQP